MSASQLASPAQPAGPQRLDHLGRQVRHLGGLVAAGDI
ncbi:hypothetical protein I553_3033 [Mycobacterium xenopi 4042]|uniref:Uncharacterized protein n=1 Tax=Mycobacterium xenopi 4042 TaxID=1299334 RepID=X7ZM80_MYCXE|nr:hypothetical protein I553_3033 [Mycobacterium xenopi 4042]